MDIELIDKQSLVFRIGNNKYMFVKPHFLYLNFGQRINATIKGSTLGWNIDGNFISYNKLKELFNEKRK